MSDKKTVIKTILIVFLIVAITVGAIVGGIFLFKKNKNSSEHGQNVSTVSSEQLESEINSCVLNKQYSTDFNGNYKLTSILDFTFDDENLTYEQQKQLYKTIGNANNRDMFRTYLMETKKSTCSNEIITLSNGKFTVLNNKKITKRGLFFGNQNKSYVYLQDDNGTIPLEINGQINNYKIACEISQTNYWTTNNFSISNNILLIREKFSYGTVKEKYITVTYIYSLIEEE